MANSVQAGKVILVCPKTIEFEKRARSITVDWCVANLGSILDVVPQIKSVTATSRSQKRTFLAVSSQDQKPVVESVKKGNQVESLRPAVNYLEDDIKDTIPWSHGVEIASLRLEPVSIGGMRTLAGRKKGAKPEEVFESNMVWFSDIKPNAFYRITRGRLKNALISGARDRSTGAVIVPSIRFKAEPGNIVLRVTFEDGSSVEKTVEVRQAPEPEEIESQYVAGDGHVHTDYSWYRPTIHIPNGPTIAQRAADGADKGLSWMFFTDYSIQFFSKYSKGGISHKGNADIDPNTEKPYRTIVWDDHCTECQFAEQNYDQYDERPLLIPSQEVPSDTDSHSLVWASMGRAGSWQFPERVRSEQFDAPLLSLWRLLKFILFRPYCNQAFAHDQPWQDTDIYMNPYEGYNRPPYIYREHDLVWAGGFARKPFVVAAHPRNSSYTYIGLSLTKDGNGWRPMANSHALGSFLVGFEIFEHPTEPSMKAKPEVVSVWNMFLWREMRESFINKKFLVAFANSDAHLSGFSGNNKFGKTKTFARVENFKDTKVDRFSLLMDALEHGRCTCTSTGDFGTFTLDYDGKTFHPGDFVDIEESTRLKFNFFGRPSSSSRTFKLAFLYAVVNPQKAGDGKAEAKDEKGFLSDLFTFIGRNRQFARVKKGQSRTSIELDLSSQNLIIPGLNCIEFGQDHLIACLRAELIFEDDHGQHAIVYTNPIFIRFKMPKTGNDSGQAKP